MHRRDRWHGRTRREPGPDQPPGRPPSSPVCPYRPLNRVRRRPHRACASARTAPAPFRLRHWGRGGRDTRPQQRLLRADSPGSLWQATAEADPWGLRRFPGPEPLRQCLLPTSSRPDRCRSERRRTVSGCHRWSGRYGRWQPIESTRHVHRIALRRRGRSWWDGRASAGACCGQRRQRYQRCSLLGRGVPVREKERTASMRTLTRSPGL